jgi:hypothetical protein
VTVRSQAPLWPRREASPHGGTVPPGLDSASGSTSLPREPKERRLTAKPEVPVEWTLGHSITVVLASAATGQPKTASTAVRPSAAGRRLQFDVGRNGRGDLPDIRIPTVYPDIRKASTGGRVVSQLKDRRCTW